jgi:hypothetical protein
MAKSTYARGRILQVLARNDGLQEAKGVREMMKALDNLLISLSANQLDRELMYLERKGLVECTRRKDIPGWDRSVRGSGRPEDIIAVKLTAKGLDMEQGAIPLDPGVEFEVEV